MQRPPLTRWPLRPNARKRVGWSHLDAIRFLHNCQQLGTRYAVVGQGSAEGQSAAELDQQKPPTGVKERKPPSGSRPTGPPATLPLKPTHRGHYFSLGEPFQLFGDQALGGPDMRGGLPFRVIRLPEVALAGLQAGQGILRQEIRASPVVRGTRQDSVALPRSITRAGARGSGGVGQARPV